MERDRVAHALATVRLNEAQTVHGEKLMSLNTHQQQLQAATQMIETLSMMHAAMMC